MKYPPDMWIEYTPEDPKKLRHWRLMAYLYLERRKAAERKRVRAVQANREHEAKGLA